MDYTILIIICCFVGWIFSSMFLKNYVVDYLMIKQDDLGYVSLKNTLLSSIYCTCMILSFVLTTLFWVILCVFLKENYT